MTKSLIRLLLKERKICLREQHRPFLWEQLWILPSCVRTSTTSTQWKHKIWLWLIVQYSILNTKYHDSVKVMGSTLDDLIYKRGEYQENCTRFLKATLPTGTGEWNQLKCVYIYIQIIFISCTNAPIGVFCDGSFDVFACWPHSSPGIVSVPCPPYLPWINEGHFCLYIVKKLQSIIALCGVTFWTKNKIILMQLTKAAFIGYRNTTILWIIIKSKRFCIVIYF